MWHRSQVFVRRLLRRRKQVALTGVASAAASVGVTAGGLVIRRQGDGLQERVAELERRLEEAQQQLARLDHRLLEEVAERRAEDARLADAFRAEVQRLETLIRELDEMTTRINSRAFPVVILGIVLTTIGNLLAHYWWLGVLSVIAGLAASAWAVVAIWKSRGKPLGTVVDHENQSRPTAKDSEHNVPEGDAG
jgi:Tfp pilus assembly protein PilN